MAQWQVLSANRTTQAALGYRVHHGPGGLVHYSTAPVVADAAVAPDSSRSFCLSGEKLNMQQLNRRLASYLQQVQCLEATNQRLEHQIQKELDRKCPRELRELDGHLRTASLLQDQISECLSAQAQVKLQLLGAELTAFDLNVRFEKERERRGCLETELSDLRLQEEELQVHRLPELQSLLNDQTQQLMELQIQHQQGMQGLLAQISGGVAVEMQPTVSHQSSHLIQQLDDLRQTSVMLLNKNQNECWFNTKVSMLSSPEVTFDPPAVSEVFQVELTQLRRSAASLEEELTQLQALNMVLEASGLEQYESFVQQLVVLQQRADDLCRDLDSGLQAAAQQAEDHQALLDIKNRLETEIEDYRRLLDGLSPHGISSLHSNSAAKVTSYCVTTSPSAFRRNIKVDKTVRVQGRNPGMMEVQTVSRGHIRTVRQTPVIAPLSETVTTVQAIRVDSKAKSSPLTLINTSNLTGSFDKSENQRTGALPERIGSMTISAVIDRQNSPVEDKVHAEHRDLQNSSIVSTHICQGLDKGAVLKASKPEINTLQGITTLVPDKKSAKSTAVQAKETFTFKQTTTEAGLQANKTGTNIQTEITILCAEPEAKQGSHFITHTTTTDPGKQSAAEVKKKTETVISAQMNCPEGSIQFKHQDPARAVSLSLETPAESVRDVGAVAITASVVSGSHILKSEEAQDKVSGNLTLMDDKDIERQEKKGETEVVEVDSTLLVLRLDQSSALSNASNSEQNKVMEVADTGSGIATASSSSPDSSHNLESKTAQGITTLVPDTESARSAAVEEKTETYTSKQISTEAGLQANKTGTNIQITKTILCAEPEVKQETNFVTHTTTTDTSKQTAAEVNKETETVISAQMNCTEDSIQAKHQDPARAVSLSLETPAESVRDVGEVAITASLVSGSHILKSEEAQDKVSGDLTLMDDKDIERQEKKGETEVVEVDSTLLVLRLDQSSALSNASNSEQNKVMEVADTGSGIATASSSSPDSSHNLESKTAQGITTLVPDTESARSAAVEEKTETYTSKQISTEAGLQANKTGTNIQITKTILCAEPEVKQGTHFVTHTTTTDTSEQTAAEVNKETETVISAQMNCTEDSIQAKHQDPAPVVSLSLDTPAEAAKDVKEIAVTASVVSGCNILRFEEAQGKVSGELTLMDDKDIKRQENKGEEEVEGTSLVLRLDQSLASSDASNSEQNKVTEDADTGSGIATASCGSPDSNPNLESKISITEILNKVELEVNKVKAVNSFHDTKEVKMDPTESDNEIVSLTGQEALLSTTESKKSISLTDSGVALSSSSNPEICLSPVETEVLMSMADQIFCPVDPEKHGRSPNSLLSPNDPEIFLSPNDPDTCLSPVEAEVCMSPNGEEEDEEVCQSLTEANAHVRPVEKYILSTKEEGLSFSRGQALPGEDRDTKVSISVRDGDSLCFGSFEGNEGSSTRNGTNNSKPTSSLGGLEFRGPGSHSIIADKEEQLGFGGLYRNCVRDAKSLGDRNKDTGGIADSKDVQNRDGSPESRNGSEDHKETSSMDSEERGQKNSDCQVANMPGNSDRVFIKSASFGNGPANGGTTFTSVASNSRGMAANKSGTNDLVTSFGGMAANSLGTLSGNAGAAPTAGVEGRFRHGSGEWMVYGSSLGRTSMSLPSTESKESMSVAMVPATSRPETGRFGSKGSGEWIVYGGSLRHKSSLDGGASLLSKGKEDGSSVATNPATNPQETGRFDTRGSGERMCYGGSLGRKSSLPSTGSEKSPSVAMFSATSQPETRKFGSRGSGEWRVYGGSTGCMSSLARSDSLPNVESPSVAMQLATSPPGAVGAGRLGSGGSGEWRVYGGSIGSLSSASSADRVSVSANAGQMISPPSSHISSGPRVSSAGSGGRLSSGSVVKRSSSVGSGGRLSSSGSGGRLSSSSGSHGISSSGRFASTGSGEWKPVYSSSSARKSSVGSAGRSGGGTTSSQRAPSPGGRMTGSMGSGGWLSSSTVGGNRISSSGSGSKLSSAGSSDRISSRTGGKTSSSSGSGRTNSTGGRVISSSDRPIRSTGSGAGGNKERISVCKMAALTISAAGRERSQDRRGQAQWSQQQQQAAAPSPLVQRWLTTGVRVKSANPDGLDDIMRL